MTKIHARIRHQLQVMAKHMSLDAAARRLKAAELGRLDFIIDEVVKSMRAQVAK